MENMIENVRGWKEELTNEMKNVKAEVSRIEVEECSLSSRVDGFE